MFEITSSIEIPWVVIKGNNKESARKEAMRYLLNLLPYKEKGITGENLIPNDKIINVYNGQKNITKYS